MGTPDMQKLDGRKFKQARRRTNSSSFLPVSPLISIIIIIIITIILGIITMFQFTSLIPSIDLSLIFELIPRIYHQIFTPFYLFFLLNLLIVSIFAMTHLPREAPLASPPCQSSSPFDLHEMKRLRTDHADIQDRFAGIKLNDDHSADFVKVHEVPNSVMSSGVDEQQTAYNLHFSLGSVKQLHRQGDRSINQADSEDFVHLDEISAASTMAAASNSVASKKLINPDACNYGGPADNGPYMQANYKVITESDVAEEINEDHAAQKTKKAADFSTVGCSPVSADPLISKPNLLLNSEEGVSLTPKRERPLASAHFTHKKATTRLHMDMLRSNSPLKISRPNVKRGDTLDATWKAICDSKLRHSSPLNRHHITSHTWKGDNHANVKKIGTTNKSKGSSLSPLSPSKKSNHTTTGSSSGLMKLRELSIPRDELNARVESFISKFNQQIRIQREESLLNYKNMVNRGAS